MNFVWSVCSLFYALPPSELHFSNLEDVPNYISDAVPMFFVFIIFEFIAGILISKPVYSIRDTICSLSLGTVQELIGVFIKSLAIVPYCYVYEYRILESRSNNYIIEYLAAFLGCDLGYYLFHRAAHESHMLWAAHSVHHSGERYNLATALRQGSFQSLTSWLYYMPLALLGIPPPIFLAHRRLNTLYQFWIHTELIKQLPGPLEYILNTPSHHRMHHQPPGNCNYAGVLIIWDRIFGTFVCESTTRIRGVYGLAKPVGSFDPLWLNFLHLNRLFDAGAGSDQMPSTLGCLSNFVHRLLSKRVKHPWRLCVQPHITAFLFAPKVDILSVIPFSEDVIKQAERKHPQYDNVAGGSAAGSLSKREWDFLSGRLEREGKVIFSATGVVAYSTLVIFFLGAVAVSYAVMIFQEDSAKALCMHPLVAAWLSSSGAPLGTAGAIGVSNAALDSCTAVPQQNSTLQFSCGDNIKVRDDRLPFNSAVDRCPNVALVMLISACLASFSAISFGLHLLHIKGNSAASQE